MPVKLLCIWREGFNFYFMPAGIICIFWSFKYKNLFCGSLKRHNIGCHTSWLGKTSILETTVWSFFHIDMKEIIRTQTANKYSVSRWKNTNVSLTLFSVCWIVVFLLIISVIFCYIWVLWDASNSCIFTIYFLFLYL